MDGPGIRARLAACIAGALVAAALTAAPAAAAPTWLEPVTLNTVGAETDVAVTNRGAATLVWTEHHDNPLDPQGDTAVLTQTRVPGGDWVGRQELTGPNPQPIVGGLLVGVDELGGAVAVWAEGEAGDKVRVLRAAVRSPAGIWSAPETLATDTGAPPELVVDADGRATVVWEAGVNGNNGLSAKTYLPGQGWGARVSLTDDTPFGFSLAVGPGGRAALAWRRGNDDVFARVRGADGGWEPSREIGAGGILSFDLAYDPDGSLVAVWSEDAPGDRSDVRSARRGPDAPTFGAQADVVLDVAEVLDVRLVVGRDGTQLVTWVEGESSLRYASASRGGAWSAGFVPAPNVTIVVDEAVLDSGRVMILRQNPGALGLIATAFTPGAGWSGTETVTGDTLDGVAHLAADDQGNAIATWGGNGGTRARAFDAAGPRLEGLAFPAGGETGTELSFAVAPVDVWSTTGIPRWVFEDGGSAEGAAVKHAYARAGNYPANVTVVDGIGNVSTATQVVPVRFPTPGTPGGPSGGGGVAGETATLRAVTFEYTFNARRYGRRTRVTLLVLNRVPSGAKVELRCRGRGCPFTKRTPKVARRMRLGPLFKKRRMRPGLVIQIRVSRTGFMTRILQIRTRATRGPKLDEVCQVPGQSTTRRCPA